MKLYFSPGACSMAPHLILMELGIPHSTEMVDLRAQPHVLKKSGEPYASINPKGSVPALKLDSGEVLTEAAVILQYLADQNPDSGLFPKAGSLKRYQAMEWLNFVSSDIHKTLGQLWNPSYSEEAREVIKEAVDHRLKFLDQHFGKQSYLTGDSYSIADAYLWVILNWMSMHKLDMAQYPNLKKFHDRIGSRPAAGKVLKAEGLI